MRSGARCPECGTTVPKPVRTLMEQPRRVMVRDEIYLMWHGLGNAVLAPVLLLTPLPCLIPWGVVLAVCLGFAPAFRLMSMRAFDLLPDEFAEPLAPLIASARRMQLIELAFAGAISGIAALWTFGLLPEGSTFVYYVVLVLWWMVAARAMNVQLQLGAHLADLLVDADSPHTRSVERLRQGTTLAIVLALGGAAALVSTNSGLLSAGTVLFTGFETIFSVLGVLLLGSAALLFGAIALGARGHAMYVAECVFESEALRQHDFTNKPVGTVGDAYVPPSRLRPPPRTSDDEDDAPIPLS